MAFFIRDTGDNRTPKQHSLDIFKQYILGTFFNTLLGKKGSGKPIIMDQSSFKGMGCGDTRTYHFVPQYFGEGIEGQNASIMGNEKTIDEFITEVRVDQIAQAFKKKGKMTDLRTIINLRAEFKDQLANWFRWRTENDMVAALTGYITDGVTRLSGSAADSTALVNGNGRCFISDSTAATKGMLKSVLASSSSNASLGTNAALGADSKMTTKVLDELQSAAKTEGKYPMKPIRLQDGNEYYMLLLHPKAAIQLRSDTRWETRALNSYNGCRSLENDPIASGAMGIWERIIVKEANYITTATNNSKTFARNLLLGADAAIMAYAQTLDYREEEFDYKRVFGVAADEIRGIRKLTFDGVDMNVAQLITTI